MKFKKNVCIVTWFGSPNFGTNLQAFALLNVLKKEGYCVKILSQLPPFSNKQQLLQYYLFKFKPYRVWLRLKRLFSKANESFYFFFFGNPAINKWVKKTLKPTILNFPFEIRRLVAKTDCFIVGSDQVWNTFVGFDPTMYLDFAGDKKRISYASSMGATSINPRFMEEVIKHLLRFSHISLREPAAATLIEHLLERTDVTSVLDPTLLLSQQEWSNICCPYNKFLFENSDYIFCYLIGDKQRYKEIVLDIWQQSGVKNLVIVPSCENPTFSIDQSFSAKNISPPEFVWLIKNAKLICTDSFHATALSINFGKRFVELLRFDDKDVASQNSRIYEILNRYGLKSRLYNKNSTLWQDEIDYSLVHKLLECDRKSSLDWLLDSIEN